MTIHPQATRTSALEHPHCLAPADSPVIETPMMRHAMDRTLVAHAPRGGFVGWYGRSTAGKTTTARWLARSLASDFDANKPGAFNAKLFEASPMMGGRSHVLHKRMIRSVFVNALLEPLDPAIYRGDVTELARFTAEALQAS